MSNLLKQFVPTQPHKKNSNLEATDKNKNNNNKRERENEATDFEDQLKISLIRTKKQKLMLSYPPKLLGRGPRIEEDKKISKHQGNNEGIHKIPTFSKLQNGILFLSCLLATNQNPDGEMGQTKPNQIL